MTSFLKICELATSRLCNICIKYYFLPGSSVETSGAMVVDDVVEPPAGFVLQYSLLSFITSTCFQRSFPNKKGK